MELMRFLGRSWAGLVCLFLAAALVGCATSSDEAKNPFKFDPLQGQEAPATPAAPVLGAGASVTATETAAPVNSGASSGSVTNTLRNGDSLMVSFSDTPTEIHPFQDAIKEDGSITLIWNQKFQAAGKTPKELQEEIRARYIGKYYQTLTVTVTPADRFFTVSGEVRMPNRYVYTGHMTVLEAIATAGGFTDFSKKTAVQLHRKDKSESIVDCKRALTHPELNLELVPGDIVHVKKRILFE